MKFKSEHQKIWERVSGDPNSLVSLALRYLGHIQEKNGSPATYAHRKYYLGFFLIWCRERDVVGIGQVDQPLIEKYQAYLCEHYSRKLQAVLSDNGRRYYLMNISLFFQWLVQKDILFYNPAGQIEIPLVVRKLPPPALTQDQAEAIINEPDITTSLGLRDRAILETLYSTGIRAGELIKLKISDMDTTRETLLVREGKGKKDRVVPIGERALAWIEKYIEDVRKSQIKGKDTGYLFLTQYGTPIRSEPVLGDMIRHYIRKHRKTGACHIFRHAMATLMLENGADIRYIQEILGHTDLKTTERYTHVSVGKLKQVHSLTHPAEIYYEEGDDR